MYTTMQQTRVVTGTNFWVTVNGMPDHVTPGYESYFHYLVGWDLVDSTGTPAEDGEVFLVYQNGTAPPYQGYDGLPWVFGDPFQLHVLVPEVAQGGYTFRFHMNCVGNVQPFEEGARETITVPIEITTTPPAPSSDDQHPIPGLAAWEEHMVDLADRWMPELMNPDNILGTNNYYYDVCSTYLGIGQYWRNAMRWFDVAVESGMRYLDYLNNVCTPPGAANGWTVFPRGLRQMFAGTREMVWLDGLRSLLKSAWAWSAGSPDPALMRETAYALAVYLELEWVEEGDREMAERAVTYLIEQFNLFTEQDYGKGKGVSCQPCMFGLAFQSLIDYYQFRRDARIPAAIAGACAWLWENAINHSTGYVLYDVWNPGGDAFTSLNGMMVNGWGFLYSLTGSAVWRQQGDLLFEHMFDDGEYIWSPKQFAQIYRRTPDYVTKWRA